MRSAPDPGRPLVAGSYIAFVVTDDKPTSISLFSIPEAVVEPETP